jgi:hypothetical protein
MSSSRNSALEQSLDSVTTYDNHIPRRDDIVTTRSFFTV